MAATSGASTAGGGEGGRGGVAGGLEAKGWSPDEDRDTGTEIFENGEFLPSQLDTTQPAYNAVVSDVENRRVRRRMYRYEAVFFCVSIRGAWACFE